MEAWKSLVALAVAGVFAAGPAWAQSSTPPADKPATDKNATGTMEKKSDKSTTGAMDKNGKMDKAGKMDKPGKMHAAKAGNREHVKAAQQALKDKGHDPGAIDGVMGAKTKAALKDFQKAQGLKESGSLDNDTMAKLGVDMKTSATGSSSAPSASPATDTKSDAKADAPKAGAPKTDSQPSASPSTGTTDPAKPADTTKPTEEKKQ